MVGDIAATGCIWGKGKVIIAVHIFQKL